MKSKPGRDQSTILSKGWTFVWTLIAFGATLACSLTTRLTTQPVQLASPEAPLGLIAYVGTDGNIYTIDRDGKHQTAITQDADQASDPGQMENAYLYPTWAPDGKKLAFVGFDSHSSAGPQASLYTVSPDGNNRVTAFNSQDSFPFYLFWSPNSEQITFLATSADGMSLALFMAPAAGGASQIIGTGQPFYWDWSPDTKAIAVHTGGAASLNPDAHLALYELNGSIQRKEIQLNPGSFQAPAWSPAGDELVLTAENDAGEDELVLIGRAGIVKQVLTRLAGPAAFAWSPKGDRLAYTVPVEEDPSGLTNQLILLDPAKSDSGKEVVKAVVVAFFWSPDSRKIAYLLFTPDKPETSQILAQSAPGITLNVKVYDLDSGDTRQIATFSPTESFQQVFPYFDQYQRSGTIWSPDSKNLSSGRP